HAGVARSVHGDAEAVLIAATAEVSGIKEGRIDNQRPAGVIRGYLKADSMCVLKDIPARDLSPRPIHILVGVWLAQSKLAVFHYEHKSAFRVERQFFGPSQIKRDGTRIGARSHDEVVFQLPLVAV